MNTGDKHTRLPWRISDDRKKIIGAEGPNGEPGGTVANLTALDLPNAELIVKAVNLYGVMLDFESKEGPKIYAGV